MADRYFRVDLFGADGDSAQNVIEDSVATPGAVVDVRITYDAANNSKMDAINAVNAVLMYLTQDSWPPA